MSHERLHQRIDPAGAASVPPPAASILLPPPPPSGRTWLDAALALPDRFVGPAPIKARVYRTSGNPDDPTIGPCWHWRCEACHEQGNGCLHQVIHEPGTWTAVMCAGIQHIHRRHPPSGIEYATIGHTTMFGRRRCDWSSPNASQLRLASWTLSGRTGMPRGAEARAFAREILALAGYQR